MIQATTGIIIKIKSMIQKIKPKLQKRWVGQTEVALPEGREGFTFPKICKKSPQGGIRQCAFFL